MGCVLFAVSADAAQCNSGYVFVNNQCVACTSRSDLLERATQERIYCPGIDSNANFTLEQQIKKCPNGAWPNANLTDCDCKYGLTKQNGKCSGSLSRNDLLYGPNGGDISLADQCWTKYDTLSYQRCMGFDTDDSSDDNNDCGYVVLGKPWDMGGTWVSGDNTFEQVTQQTNLGDKIMRVRGAAAWGHDVLVVRAVKSPLANTPDGCACPMYTFKYKGKTGCFYNWNNSNELTTPIETIRALNPNIPLNNGFACLLEENCTFVADKNRIKFSFACDASATPDPDKNPYSSLFFSQITTGTYMPHTVAEYCPSSNKPGWHCRTLLRDAHDFYLDPSKMYKDNTSLREYINTYGATDCLHVRQGLQYYGKSREVEMIVTFCTPSDLP